MNAHLMLVMINTFAMIDEMSQSNELLLIVSVLLKPFSDCESSLCNLPFVK